jgi:hypothetical protein
MLARLEWCRFSITEFNIIEAQDEEARRIDDAISQIQHLVNSACISDGMLSCLHKARERASIEFQEWAAQLIAQRRAP